MGKLKKLLCTSVQSADNSQEYGRRLIPKRGIEFRDARNKYEGSETASVISSRATDVQTHRGQHTTSSKHWANCVRKKEDTRSLLGENVDSSVGFGDYMTRASPLRASDIRFRSVSDVYSKSLQEANTPASSNADNERDTSNLISKPPKQPARCKKAKAANTEKVPDDEESEVFVSADEEFGSVSTIDQRMRSPSMCTQSQLTISVTSEDIRKTITGRTDEHLNRMLVRLDGQTHVRGYKTQLFWAAKRKLERTGHPNIVIFKGSGYGGSFVASMLFAELCSDGRKGYMLYNPKEWLSIAYTNKTGPVVILIKGAEMDKWKEYLKHDILERAKDSGSHFVVIIKTNDACPTQLIDYIVDPLHGVARPTHEDKSELFDRLAKEKRFKILEGNDEIAEEDESPGWKTIYAKEKEDILEVLGDVRWVERLTVFFSEENSDKTVAFLVKPDKDCVDIFKQYDKSSKLKFAVLICVYVHGSLTPYMVNEIVRICQSVNAKQRSVGEGLDKLIGFSLHKTKKRFTGNTKVFFQYMKKHDLWHDFADDLDSVLSNLEGRFLLREPDCFTFANESVQNAFLVRLSMCDDYLYFSSVLAMCNKWFFFNVISSCRARRGWEPVVTLRRENKEEKEAFYDRVEKQWLQGDVEKCVSHPLVSRFFLEFKERLSKKQIMALMQTLDSKTGHSALYHGIENNDLEKMNKKDTRLNIAEVFITHRLWKDIRRKDTGCNWQQEEEASLAHAAALANTHTFKCLIENGVLYTESALVCAVKGTAVDIVAHCISRAALPRRCFNVGLVEAFKQYAAEPECGERKKVFHLLCLSGKTNVNFYEPHTKPLLFEVISARKLQMLKLLLEDDVLCKNTVDVNIVWKDIEGAKHTALSFATELCYENIVKYLLEKGANQRQIGTTQRPVTIAAKMGFCRILAIFVEENLSIINERDCGKLPIDWAKQCGKEECVRYLQAKNGSDETSPKRTY